MTKNSAHSFRPLSDVETIFIKTETQIVSRSIIKGKVSKQNIITAIKYFETKYPILRAIVKSNTFVERHIGAETSLEWLSTATTTAANLYSKLLNIKLNLSASLYNIYILSNDAEFEVFIVISHAIADATSLITLHNKFVYYCDCAIHNIIPFIDKQPFAKSVDDAVESTLMQLNKKLFIHSIPSVKENDFISLPLKKPSLKTPPEYQLYRIVIESDKFKRIKRSCLTHKISLHGALSAAFILAIQNLSTFKAPQILIRSSIDIRRRTIPPLSPDLVFTAATGHTTLINNLNLNIRDLAKNVTKEIGESSKNGTIFYGYKKYAENFVTTSAQPPAINLSNMGNIELQEKNKLLEIVGFEYALGWHKPCPNVSITVHKDKFVANMVYATKYMTEELAAKLAEIVTNNLELDYGANVKNA